MPLSEQELLQVLEMFQQSSWQGMQLRSGQRTLVMSKNGHVPGTSASRTPLQPAPSAMPAATPSAAAAVSAVRTAPAAADAVNPRWIAVRAPMLGTFYSAPKPGAPPFVALGQRVAANDTVGILEVMKLMNDLKAGVAGTIARICAVNGELAEFEQPLLYIEPGA